MHDTNFYDSLRIGLAAKDDIEAWSFGEVKKPETINYRTLKPEPDGLFCEKIFGPTRDWECFCGKYKRVRFKGIKCERCGVEITRSAVRRERMGIIKLEAPVTHVWYFRGVPSRLGYLLDIAPKDLEKVIYFAAYMITKVDEDARHRDLPMLEAKIQQEREVMVKRRDAQVETRLQKLEEDMAALEAEGAKAEVRKKVRDGAEKELKALRDRTQRDLDRLEAVWSRFKALKVQDLEGDEVLYREMKKRWGGKYFEGCMGAEAVKRRLQDFDLNAEADKLRETIKSGKGQRKTRALKRLKVVSAFLAAGNSPQGMVLDVIPVIPPDLRPMVQLDGGRFATSDLNDLYRRVINRNNRLKKLMDLGAPEIIVNNEKRMLQEAVDSLFDNGRRGRPVTGPGNRPLKSISDMLKGKQGRFRQNLLGKRVDYSGRSVIVVGPQLRMHQCGLPKAMALELFKPFVMKRLTDLNHAQNIKAAKRMVERQRPVVWDVLEEVIQEHPVLLNRAPTLHRLGIQAFEPLLIEGKAIQLHPLVCSAFNADFDGDQMAVHLPLSAEAQAEARVLMLSSNNILKPADGRPVALPSHEMIIGAYFLTLDREGFPGEGRAFSSVAEAIMAFDAHEIKIGSKIKIKFGSDVVPPAGTPTRPDGSFVLDTTLGRAIFNDALPQDFPFVNYLVDKKKQGVIVNELAERYSKGEVTATLDRLKDMGFKWGTQSGVTVSISDMLVPPSKPEILARYDKKANKIDKLFERGAVTEEEKRSELNQIWTEATAELTAAMEANFTRENPIFMMVQSGARGNMTQMRQISAMRGLVANPKGEIITRPIKSNFREGLTVLEYFISTHGGRKGQADTALKTADSGYLTRRLVDVSQDVIIREIDCGTERGLAKTIAHWTMMQDTEDGPKEVEVEPFTDGSTMRLDPSVETSVYARTLAEDVTDPKTGEIIAAAGVDLGDVNIRTMANSGVTKVKVRSVLTCESAVGTCAMCYGRALASGKLVDVGEAVGIVAAQSIGEPGTQLTMRTFHTGGVAGDDITTGLPRVQELFEARVPKGKAPMAQASGVVEIDDADSRSRKIIIKRDDGEADLEYAVPRRARIEVSQGQRINAGQQLTAGTLDPQDVLLLRGIRACQQHLVDEVQKVYRTQGAPIHDKHIEIIIRQMMRRVTVIEAGDTNMLPGELADRSAYEAANRKAIAEGGTPAQGRPVLMGITKASLATDSWLSAASFQETTKVLTDAAINGKSDNLVGLKENVILGKLIPAGTGLDRYRNIKVEPTPEARAAAYNVINYDPYKYDFGTGTGEAVRLDEIDLGGTFG